MGFAGDGILQVVRGALDLAEDLQVRMGMNGFRFGCRSKQSGRLREAVFFRLLGIGKVFAVGFEIPRQKLPTGFVRSYSFWRLLFLV